MQVGRQVAYVLIYHEHGDTVQTHCVQGHILGPTLVRPIATSKRLQLGEGAAHGARRLSLEV